MDEAIQPGSMQLMDAAALEPLFTSLRDAGFSVIGPTVRDGAIVLAELGSAADLPFGWGVELAPGGYRLRRRTDGSVFAHSAGPGSWKQFLHPPREKLWSARLADGGIEFSTDDVAPPRLAFFGVRPSDLRAIQIQDQVPAAGGGNSGDSRREVLIVAVNCGRGRFRVHGEPGPPPGRTTTGADQLPTAAALVHRGHRHTGNARYGWRAHKPGRRCEARPGRRHRGGGADGPRHARDRLA